MCQRPQPRGVPVGDGVLPAVPKRFAAEAREFAQAAEVVPELEDGPAVVSAFGDDRADRRDAVAYQRVSPERGWRGWRDGRSAQWTLRIGSFALRSVLPRPG